MPVMNVIISAVFYALAGAIALGCLWQLYEMVAPKAPHQIIRHGQRLRLAISACAACMAFSCYQLAAHVAQANWVTAGIWVWFMIASAGATYALGGRIMKLTGQKAEDTDKSS